MTKAAPKVPAEPAPVGLVGRCFHIFGEDNKVSHQGRVVAQIDATHYLVQFFDWMVGDPSTMSVYSIDAISHASFGSERGYGAWQFYENHEHFLFWFEHYARRDG